MFFEPNKSSSYKPTNVGVEIVFGSGPLRGFFAYDDVRLGELGDDGNGENSGTALHIKN